jgi:hypothetical protein
VDAVRRGVGRFAVDHRPRDRSCPLGSARRAGITRPLTTASASPSTSPSTSPGTEDGRLYESPIGWTAEVPAGWHVLEFSGFDRISVEGTSFSNVRLEPTEDGMHPDLSELFPDGAALIVSHREGGPAPDYVSDDSTFPLRWEDFQAIPGGLVVGSVQSFRANGSEFTIELAARGDAPESLLQAVRAIFDSIRPIPLTTGETWQTATSCSTRRLSKRSDREARRTRRTCRSCSSTLRAATTRSAFPTMSLPHPSSTSIRTSSRSSGRRTGTRSPGTRATEPSRRAHPSTPTRTTTKPRDHDYYIHSSHPPREDLPRRLHGLARNRYELDRNH